MQKSSKIIVSGDSLAYGRIDPEGNGWVSRLRKWFEEKAPAQNAVFNLGVGGHSTTKMLPRFEIELVSRGPDLILLEVGVNDCRHVDLADAPIETPPDVFISNYNKIICSSKKLTDRIIILSMIPVDEKRTTPIGNLFHFLHDQKVYHQLMLSIAKENSVHFINLFDEWLSDKNYSNLLEDGLHPNSQGHEKIYQSVKLYLQQVNYI
ncbi:MAG: SGNH/GDSL hydrolase family protein [Candidatus Thorarchaeota archaeon]